jgi:hypothetical protein
MAHQEATDTHIIILHHILYISVATVATHYFIKVASEAQQYMRSYQAHQLLSLTLSNYSSISGNCTGISTANQRSLYTFETV